uniref:UPAR/Ly6 domain-containing protein n=1 Tax=Denticeps clupeoides TaxID=299321 RepID=A0AAY4EY74_9TELE
MKLVLVFLTVVLVVTNGNALICNHCVPSSPGASCTLTKEVCTTGKDACISARFTFPPYMYFRRCISVSDCRTLQLLNSGTMRLICCQQDLCNLGVF